ncbi:DUF4760 domain-containing protein [Arcobacter cloacae]|uniref:DUF4760 domain-containing protein n=1 Tax=Arcobacter cloacae TaxID=1054034 RepID=A0A4Q0ZKP2_9BACT|nr:DUF4760 domain-containing protein [Arcobacter cloacae]RXJ84068.1 DUF4760 domain-containing protein [Arcobacter cloacae]
MNKRVWITILWLLLTFGVTYLTYQTAAPDKKIFDSTSIFLLMVGGYGVILTLINHTEVIEQNNKILIEQKKDAILENTYRLIKAWDDEHLLKARQWTRDIKRRQNNLSANKLINKIEKDKDLEGSVVLVLNYIENVRMSLETERVDAKLMKQTLGNTLNNIIERFKPFAIKLDTANENDLKQCQKLLGF